MRENIDERVLMEGEYIAVTKSTIRQTAKVFKRGKSSVHKDIIERLKSLDADLYNEVRKVLDNNLKERHLRGGIATKEKFEREKQILKEIKND